MVLVMNGMRYQRTKYPAPDPFERVKIEILMSSITLILKNQTTCLHF